MHIYAYIYMHVYAYIDVHVCVCVHTYIYTYMHIYIYAYICIYIYICIHVYIYIYTYMYGYMHTYMNYKLIAALSLLSPLSSYHQHSLQIYTHSRINLMRVMYVRDTVIPAHSHSPRHTRPLQSVTAPPLPPSSFLSSLGERPVGCPICSAKPARTGVFVCVGWLLNE